MSEELKLLQCPFCGSCNLNVFITEHRFKDNHIVCEECGGKMQIAMEYGEEEIYKRWNRRE